MINAITAAEKGDCYFMECQHYYRGECYPSGVNASRCQSDDGSVCIYC